MKVTVLHPHTGGVHVWEHMRTNWMKYGKVPLNLSVCRTFSLSTLQNSDVVVIGDVAGAPYQFTPEEISVIQQYATLGTKKHLLATYAAFYHQEGPQHRLHVYDNRALAPLFGIPADTQLTTRRLEESITYDTVPTKILWDEIPNPFLSYGYSSSQVPFTQQKWIDGEKTVVPLLPTASVVAKSRDGVCVIVKNITETFSSLFVSSMPEYESLVGQNIDCQFLYNAFLFLVRQNVDISLTHLCIGALKPETDLFVLPKTLVEMVATQNPERKTEEFSLSNP
ncbi:hypothetical protein EIN_411130 [Entamoeba invadens IP1]|uniref:Uncharacterized protein n=1 Tax=Entamoeba invadens IP1 TaxID=370355 RepID=A0A0A1U173_ENTIV|nr:hypothetical protein EIN_411130 [Entamoeba invadens IP1]ELP87760.1 hypothetical protein EIN_411130 [Entamoeba invadens IP1]|eukprot:XP_004254531.1 hypothetical protein EIN_411130 [Entamoeba invadens IP1]